MHLFATSVRVAFWISSIGLQVFFIESVCDDPGIISENIRVSVGIVRETNFAGTSLNVVKFGLILLYFGSLDMTWWDVQREP